MTSVQLYQRARSLPDIATAAQAMSMGREEDFTAVMGWQLVEATVLHHAYLGQMEAAIAASKLALQRRPSNLATAFQHGWVCPADRCPSSQLMQLGGMVTKGVIDGLASCMSNVRGVSHLSRSRGGLIFPLETAPGLTTGFLIVNKGRQHVLQLVAGPAGAVGGLNIGDRPPGHEPTVLLSDFEVFAALYDRLRRTSDLGTGLAWVPNMDAASILANTILGGARVSLASLTEPRSAVIINAARFCGSETGVSGVDKVLEADMVTGEFLATKSAEAHLIELRTRATPWYDQLAKAADGMGPVDLAAFALSLHPFSEDERRQLGSSANGRGATKLLNLLGSRVAIRRFTVDKLTVVEHPAAGWAVETKGGDEEKISDTLIRFDEITLVGSEPVISGVVTASDGTQISFSAEEKKLRTGLADFVTTLCVARGIYPVFAERYRRKLFSIARCASTPVVRKAVQRVGMSAESGAWEFPRVSVFPLGETRRVVQREQSATVVHGVPGWSLVGGISPPPLPLREWLAVPSNAASTVITCLAVCLHNLVHNERRIGLAIANRHMQPVVVSLGQQLGLVNHIGDRPAPTLLSHCAAHDLPVVCGMVNWGLPATRRKLLERPNLNMVTLVGSPQDALLLASYPGMAVLHVAGELEGFTVEGCETALPWLLSHVDSRTPPETLAGCVAFIEDKLVCHQAYSPDALRHGQCNTHWWSVVNAIAYVLDKRGMDFEEIGPTDDKHLILTTAKLMSGQLVHRLFDPHELDEELLVAPFQGVIHPQIGGWSIDLDWLRSMVNVRRGVVYTVPSVPLQ